MLGDAEVPLEVELKAFNPLVPADAETSGIPVAVLTYELRNPTSQPVEASVCGTLPNFIGMDGFETVRVIKQQTRLRAIPIVMYTSKGGDMYDGQARALGAELGLDLASARAGGGSDGNTTSQYTATLDGLGPVGDGAHAVHEFLYVDASLERAALLALLLAAPLPAADGREGMP